MVTRNARVSDLAVAKVRRFCDQRVPTEARHQVCLEVTTRAATITILERRPLWEGDLVRGPACRSPNFAMTLPRAPGPSTGRILGGPQPTLAPLRPPRPNPQLDDLLKEIDQDPLSMFWG